MSYALNIEINGYEFQFGDMAFPSCGIGAFINFNDPKIKAAIADQSTDFFDSLKSLFMQSEELDALYTINNFEHYFLQGHGWHSLTSDYGFKSQQRFHNQALIVLKGTMADESQRRIAETIIEVLNGNYRPPAPPEKSPEEKARASFERKKPKLKLKITIDRGYKCDICSNTTENSLCILRKDESICNYELENLVLRCRSCMNKLKKKK